MAGIKFHSSAKNARIQKSFLPLQIIFSPVSIHGVWWRVFLGYLLPRNVKIKELWPFKRNVIQGFLDIWTYLCTFDIKISIFQVPLISFQVNNFSVILLIWETNISYYMTRMSNYISDVQSRSRSRNLATPKMNFFV